MLSPLFVFCLVVVPSNTSSSSVLVFYRGVTVGQLMASNIGGAFACSCSSDGAQIGVIINGPIPLVLGSICVTGYSSDLTPKETHATYATHIHHS